LEQPPLPRRGARAERRGEPKRADAAAAPDAVELMQPFPRPLALPDAPANLTEIPKAAS
jgi:hypothetical protein